MKARPPSGPFRVYNLFGSKLVNHLLDLLENGWELEEGNLIGKMSSRDIAPLEVVELVACKCKGNLNETTY